MTIRIAIFVATGLLVQACSAWHSGWPSWATTLEERLQCGMSILEVQSLTKRKVEVERMVPRLGTHRISSSVTDVGLGFSDRGLESVSLAKVHGILQIRRSPRRNLCTGELTFFVELQWVDVFQGASVFLDDEQVAEDAHSGLIVEVPQGVHALRVETSNEGSALKQLTFRSEDPGYLFMVLGTEDLRVAQELSDPTKSNLEQE